MSCKRLKFAGLAASIAFLFTALPGLAQSPVGLVGGVARDSASGNPIAEAQIVAHNLGLGTDRTTITDAGGSFTISNLEPGRYEIAATKDGFLRSSTSVEVAALRIARVELPLQVAADVRRTAGVPTTQPLTERELQLLERIDRLEQRLAAMEAKQAGESQVSKPADPHTPERIQLALAAPAAVTPAQAAPPPPAANAALPAGQSGSAALPVAANAAAAVGNPPIPQNPAEPPAIDKQTPFADYDWTWLNGNPRTHDSPLDSKYFTGEFRADTFYGTDFNQPKDHSMGGSSEVFRSGEVQLEQISLGGDLHVGNVRGRFLPLFGMFATTTPRNDASAGVGQWDVRGAYRYLAEAYGGYHFNVNHGLNIDAGIFVSYVGLFSYYNFDNWAYQPSYVSSNTPWFFNGVRIQWFPTNHLKIEPWFINGWQSYNKFNGHPGLGGQIKYTPKPWLTIISNEYAIGNDNIGLPHRGRYHTDNSIEVKYYDRPKAGNGIDKMAVTVTGDMGCETGDGVTCHGGKGAYNPITGQGGPKQSFLGYMAYNRWWWHKDLFAFTLGGGQINNPGRYLTLVLPVNGADAISGTPYFPAYPGASFKAYDGTATFDWMPSQFFTFRSEFGYRHANVPYWSGRQGITPPGGNNGVPAQYACMSGAASGFTDLPDATAACASQGGLWSPDLRRGQALLNFAILVKF
ncbi:MAG: TonB-dependent receptor [Bryobacterales bacterium]|nr:TonB-dependent receptor [Bryobacterales bacterium]MBV9400011.1 TonB-dependent receptor [Bryobacterales bacterium]